MFDGLQEFSLIALPQFMEKSKRMAEGGVTLTVRYQQSVSIGLKYFIEGEVIHLFLAHSP